MYKIDGFDEAIIGPAMVWTHEGSVMPVLVYDGEKIRDILIKRDGMDFEGAREYIEFNIEGAYIGPTTPIVAWPNDQWSVDE